jgi:catechol 2,3-dioxygenase-like lactoylglutathione lyase family enzyme
MIHAYAQNKLLHSIAYRSLRQVDGMDRSLKFYTEAMGFAAIDETLLRGSLVHSISNGLYDEVRLVLLRASPLGAMIELLEYQESSVRTARPAGHTLSTGAVSILVPNLEEHIQRAASVNSRPVSEIFTVDLPVRGSCRLVFYEDPDSNRLEIIQRCMNPRRPEHRK